MINLILIIIYFTIIAPLSFILQVFNKLFFKENLSSKNTFWEIKKTRTNYNKQY